MMSGVISRKTHVDNLTRGRIMGKLEEDCSTWDAGNEFGVSKRVVARLWKQFFETESATRRYSSIPHKTTLKEERFMAVTAKRNLCLKAGQVAEELHESTGTTISRQNVSRWLNDVGLYTRKLLKCIQLTSANKRNRHRWYRERANGTDEQWSNVPFAAYLVSRLILGTNISGENPALPLMRKYCWSSSLQIWNNGVGWDHE